MIFKQQLFTLLLGLLFATVLTDQASALYDPGVGRFCSRDPIGVTSRYRYMNKTNISMLNATYTPYGDDKVWEYSEPPRTPFTGTKCRISMRCGNTASGSTHCGLLVETENGSWPVDGTGGPENNFDWKDIWGGIETQIFHTIEYPISVCECIRISSQTWNEQDIKRGTLGCNSNTSLRCLTKKCGLRLDFTPIGGEPFGFSHCKKFSCAKWNSISKKEPGGAWCTETVCEKWIDFCDAYLK